MRNSLLLCLTSLALSIASVRLPQSILFHRPLTNFLLSLHRRPPVPRTPSSPPPQAPSPSGPLAPTACSAPTGRTATASPLLPSPTAAASRPRARATINVRQTHATKVSATDRCRASRRWYPRRRQAALQAPARWRQR